MGIRAVLPESFPMISNDKDQRRTKQISPIKEINEVLEDRIRLSDAEKIARFGPSEQLRRYGDAATFQGR